MTTAMDIIEMTIGPQEKKVPIALLSLCLDLLLECNKNIGETGSNFDDDMALALSQLSEHLK